MDLPKPLIGLPCRPAEQMQSVFVIADVSDLFDAIQRLLADAQRFNFKLLSAAADQADQYSATIRLALEVGLEEDLLAMRVRLARHPSIASLRVETRLARG